MKQRVIWMTSAWLLVGPAFAQQRPSTEDIVKKLDPTTAVSVQPGLRDTPWGDRGITEEGTDTASPSIDLNIPFDYNSDKLTPDGIITLRRLGAALKDPRLANYRFKIAGHADAKGSADYNQKLSERRAQSVRDYLVFQYDLDPGKLETAGYGSARLADPGHPEDGVNRRVQVVNMGAQH
jgi:outer membrane protein OmpA-like peptidoglycan-associated protein